ncbi:aromatic ring-hydroxylating dioxygenase subunit alpha [Candidatus Pelagibacter sp.]|jgi:phenylpropionate dioxygenase-like ring-hydroxylating dioxygenase large terminal subunit|nr:aromatic ring-hydroxylating dioxygenase subunit alpha [Candidatus Pelagibacter sp.]MDB4081486.1 aromatic ring-hydroxylating dioxygenase subunit alpha [Candidatus Pelagibacter sp.]
MNNNSLKHEDFRGYKQAITPGVDEILSFTSPKTVCGEYLRRYWHPVALTSEISQIPREIRILGEDLVIFKTTKENIGLVHKACPHRRASMAYGKTEDEGIRCCYHGWLFSPNGEVLETPGEDPESKQAKKLRETFKLGAYPVIEFNGLVFSYLGPIDKIPEFPHYDSFEIQGNISSPYRIEYNCNWIQVLDAIMDPLHTSFLHGQSSGIQFSEGFAEVGEIDFYERGIQYLGCNTRRINDNVWVRVNELILPNFTQAGSAFAADGTKSKYFGRSSFTRWVVPIDDHHCAALAWANFGERGDPLEYNNQEGFEKIEAGEISNRTKEEKQKSPGDAEAVEGMGSISSHKGEHLMPTDKGVMIYRRRIRKLIKDLEEGQDPPQPQKVKGQVVRTNGQDTILKAPKKKNNDKEYVKSICSTIMNMQFDLEDMTLNERDNIIIKNLQEMEERGSFD